MHRPKTSAQALQLWQRVAAGERAPDLDAWVRQVAQDVAGAFAATGLDGGAARGSAVLRAVGYRGRLRQYEELDDLIDANPGRRAGWVAGLARLLVEPSQMPPSVDATKKYVNDRRRPGR